MTKAGKLFRNIWFNASAFSINALVGVFTIPLIIRNFGADGYGLIVLARLLLPTGIVGLFEGGLPEVTSRYAASSMALGDKDSAAKYLVTAFWVIFGVGVGVLIGMLLLKPYIIWILGIAPDSSSAFSQIILITALSIPLQFSGDVWRGALEGVERFDLVRSIEVTSTLVFAAIVLVIPFVEGADAASLAIAYVIVGNLRSIACFLAVFSLRSNEIPILLRPDFKAAAPMLRHARTFFVGKIYGTLFNNGPTILVALTSSVATVGLFDALMRIPRLFKTAIGMFGNVLMPFSAGNEARGDIHVSGALIQKGTVLLMLIVCPPALTLIIFSKEVLGFWLGHEHSDASAWFSLAMLWPLLLTSVSIGNSMVIARHDAVKKINNISRINLLFYAVTGAILLPFLQWKAFVIALIFSSLATTPIYLVLISREYELSFRRLLSFLLRMALLAIAAFAAKYMIFLNVSDLSVPVLGAVVLLWTAAIYIGSFYFALDQNGQKEIYQRLNRFRGFFGR